jgi:hypothetical protein
MSFNIQQLSGLAIGLCGSAGRDKAKMWLRAALINRQFR